MFDNKNKLQHKIKITPCGTIADLDKRPELTLINDSQAVAELKSMIAMTKEMTQLEDYDSFFVNIQDGEYTEIYGYSGNTPTLSKRVDCIQSIFMKNGKVERSDQVCKCSNDEPVIPKNLDRTEASYSRRYPMMMNR